MGVVDIDLFKQVNDTHGHLCGDEVLKAISFLLTKVFRRNCDSLFRYGGNEFIILTIDKEDQKSEFLSMAEQLRSRVEQYNFEYSKGEIKFNLSISTGLFFGKVDKYNSYQDIMSLADDILYKVKEAGRNKVIIND